jgi:LmbE family N-acetylglucosaminyl deacetylase
VLRGKWVGLRQQGGLDAELLLASRAVLPENGRWRNHRRREGSFQVVLREPRSVLAIGAHPDDIELGCGGTLLAHRARGDRVALLVMTTGERGPQAAKSRRAEQAEAAHALDAKLYWGDFPDGAVPDDASAVRVIEEVLARTGADLVYTHTERDTHQDHRATARATFAAARRVSRVLCYEAPTSQHFAPAMYIDIAGLVDKKLDLIRTHLSQVLKNGLVDLEAGEAQARLRGFEGRIRHAEAFEIERFVWDLDGLAKGGLEQEEIDLEVVVK